MDPEETKPTSPPPPRPFQFTLRTLLLLFVVLASSMAVFGEWGIVVFGLAVGLAIHVNKTESLLSLLYLVPVVVSLMFCTGMPATLLVPAAVQAAMRARCTDNLRQIAQALQQYHQANGRFPPAYIADKTGKPIHSWRTLILPHLDLDALYGSCKLSESWDGPNNKKLLATGLPVYECPSDPTVRTPGAAQTSYVAVVGPGAAWGTGKPRKLSDFGNEAAHTIVLIEVTNSGIAWAEPRDFSLDTLGAAAAKPSSQLSSNHRPPEDFFYTYGQASGVNVALADGSVRCLRLGNRSPEDLRRLLQVGGCTDEVLDESEGHFNWPNIAALAVWLLSVGTLLAGAVWSRKARPA